MNKIVIFSVIVSSIIGFIVFLYLLISHNFKITFTISIALISILVALASLCYSGMGISSGNREYYNLGSVYFLQGILCTIPISMISGFAILYSTEGGIFVSKGYLEDILGVVCSLFFGSGWASCVMGLNQLRKVDI